MGAFGAAGLLAFAAGALVAYRPALLALLALAALFVWSVWNPERLNYALFAVLFLVPVTVNPGYPVGPVWTVLAALLAIALFGRVQRFRPDAPAVSSGMLAFVLPGTCLLVGALRWSGVSAMVASLLPLVTYAALTWHLVEEARRDRDVPVRLARAFAWVAVPLAVLAVYQRITGTWPILDTWATSFAFTAAASAGRSAAVMGHPIIYGSYCMVAMCVALGLRGRLWPVPFTAGAVGLLLSQSRSAWIGMACALAVWYLARPKKITRRGLYVLAAVLATGTTLAAVGPRPVRVVLDIVYARIADLNGPGSSAVARYRRMAAAMSGIRENLGTVLFGRGPEAHVKYLQQIGIGDNLAQTFDNSYLTLWYDFGLCALLVLVAVIVVLFVRFRSLTARMLLAAFAVQIWFFDFYLWPCAAGTLILAAGLAVAESEAQAGSEAQARSEAPLVA